MRAMETTTSRKSQVAPASCLERVSQPFDVGPHTVSVWKVLEGRWSCAVDGGEVSSTFPTEAAAWEAGVRAAYRLDGPG